MIPFLSLKDVNAAHGEEIVEAVSRIANSGWYLQGKENERFEQSYSEFIGCKYAVGCANGLDALTLIFRAYIKMGVMEKGDEVIVPANTYIATILSITENGLVPVLIEPKIKSLEINDELIEDAITSKTRAIAIVHLYGRISYTKRIGELCRKYHLKLVEDCAQSHGCGGHYGDAAAHSFYPGKNLGALGDAGAVTTDDAELAEVVRTIANYGSQKKYYFKYAGRNSRMDEIQAAVLNVKLKYLKEDNAYRQKIARYYYENIDNPLITLPERLPDADNVYHIFPILVNGEGNRDCLRDFLDSNGIGTMCHYPVPPHLQECYANEAWNIPRLHLPVTEKIAEEELSIPLNTALLMTDAEFIVKILNQFH